MTELKTLKEIETLPNGSYSKYHLRKEAIAHAKRLELELKDASYLTMIRCGDRGVIGPEQIIGALNWVVGTFNLTEEDLK